MVIKFGKLKPHAWAWHWRPDQQVLLIGIWWFVIGVDFGIKESPWYKHFNKNCLLCKKPLNVVGRFQRVYFHRECRREGRRLFAKGKLTVPVVEKKKGFWDKMAEGFNPDQPIL